MKNGIFHAFVRSETYRELYMLLREKADGEKDSDYSVSSIRTYQYNQYDSIYAVQASCAMQAYLTGIEADKTGKWEIVYDRMFAEYGCFLDAWYTNGNRQVHLFIDIWNKLYLVIEQ